MPVNKPISKKPKNQNLSKAFCTITFTKISWDGGRGAGLPSSYKLEFTQGGFAKNFGNNSLSTVKKILLTGKSPSDSMIDYLISDQDIEMLFDMLSGMFGYCIKSSSRKVAFAKLKK